MAVFVSEQHPKRSVMAAGRGVVARFRDGRFTTTDPDTITVLERTDGVARMAEATPARTAPPARGRGASREAWLAWAAEHAVTVPDGADRDTVIAACQAAGAA